MAFWYRGSCIFYVISSRASSFCWAVAPMPKSDLHLCGFQGLSLLSGGPVRFMGVSIWECSRGCSIFSRIRLWTQELHRSAGFAVQGLRFGVHYFLTFCLNLRCGPARYSQHPCIRCICLSNLAATINVKDTRAILRMQSRWGSIQAS